MRVIVTYNFSMPQSIEGHSVENLLNANALESFSVATGTRIGQFPALLDTNSKCWVHISGTLEDANAALDVAIQASKPTFQKEYENAFFDLCQLVLSAVGDERAADSPPPKLSLDELSSMVESLESGNFPSMVKFSLKLLTLDAALKRYDVLWWNNAAYHTAFEGA